MKGSKSFFKKRPLMTFHYRSVDPFAPSLDTLVLCYSNVSLIRPPSVLTRSGLNMKLVLIVKPKYNEICCLGLEKMDLKVDLF